MHLPLITLKEADYAGWSDALWIEFDALALILVPQAGGRIMGLRWRQHDLYWVNNALANHAIHTRNFKTPITDKQSLGFLLWGGDKTWLSPQDHWTGGVPFLDLDSGAYQLSILRQSTNRLIVEMTSPICRETGICITRSIQLDGTEAHWTVTHRMQNWGDRPVRWGLWGNSMIRRPATVFLPTRPDSKFPDGVKTFAAEGDAIAARARVVSRIDDIAAIECVDPIKFKYGVDSLQGRIVAILPQNDEKYLAYVKHFPIFHPELYGHGCVAEVFNASDYPYLELEIHSPVRLLAPGESFEFSERNFITELTELPTTATDINTIANVVLK